jgi:hypothetical protein
MLYFYCGGVSQKACYKLWNGDIAWWCMCRYFTGCSPRGIPKVVSLGEETSRSETRRCKEHKTLDRFGPRDA